MAISPTSHFSSLALSRSFAIGYPQFSPISRTPAPANQPNPEQGSGAADSLDRLFSALGASLKPLDSRQGAVEQIKTQLNKFRDILQSSRNQSASVAGRPDLRAVYKALENTITKAIYSPQDVYETQAVYQTRNVYGTRDVYSTRDVYGTRNVYETRPVYGQQDIRATTATSTRDLTPYASVAAAGINDGADFTVQVGNGSVAAIQFRNSSSKIKVTVDGVATNYNVSATSGAWRTTLLTALNSIANLSASYTSDGKIQLQTSSAQTLTIATGANSAAGHAVDPLPKLGLTAGTTQSTVVGTQEVQVGTEQVVVGQEQYITGQEQYVSGQEQYVAGTEQVQTGTVEVKTGTTEVQTGSNEIVVGERSIVVEFERVQNSVDTAATDAVRRSLQSLVSAVGALGSASSGGTGPLTGAGLAGDTRTLADNLSALLRSSDFKSLGGSQDAGAFDRVIGKLNDALSQVKSIGAKIAATSSHHDLASQLQASLGAILLSHGRKTFTTDPIGLARSTADSLRGSPFSLTRNYSLTSSTQA